MMYWIRRSAIIFGGGVFFLVLIGMLVRSRSFELQYLIAAVACAFLSGVTGWFIGIVISDIVIKGMLTDIGDTGVEGMIEGGLLQRFQMMQEQLVPGGSEVPFTGPVKDQKKSGKAKTTRGRTGQ